MLFSPEWEKFLWEGIFFLTYVLICSGLMERRFSKTASLLAAGGTLVGIVLLQAALLLAGQDNTLVPDCLPAGCHLPAYSFAFRLFSDDGHLDNSHHCLLCSENFVENPHAVFRAADEFFDLGLQFTDGGAAGISCFSASSQAVSDICIRKPNQLATAQLSGFDGFFAVFICRQQHDGWHLIGSSAFNCLFHIPGAHPGTDVVGGHGPDEGVRKGGVHPAANAAPGIRGRMQKNGDGTHIPPRYASSSSGFGGPGQAK